MAKISRRDFLVITAGGVGAAWALSDEEFAEPDVSLPAGAFPENVSERVGAGGGGGGSADLVDFDTAGTLAGMASLEADIQFEWVTGANRDYGCHATYEGSLPVHAEGDGYEVAVVDALGDEDEPSIFPQWIAVVGANRDYGWHVKRQDTTGHFEEADEFTLAFGDTLGSIATPDILPQGDSVYGANRDYGNHVET